MRRKYSEHAVKMSKNFAKNVKNLFKVLSATSKESSASSTVPSAPVLPQSAPRLTNWLLRHTCFCLEPPTPKALLSGRLSELRVASGFAVRAITGASIESRLGEDSTSCTLFSPCLSRLQATGLNLWDNKECGA